MPDTPTTRQPVLFIGDEVTATGYRLAGAAVRVPRQGEDPETLLQWGLERAELLLLGADLAARLEPERLAAAQTGLRPLLLVVPDVRGRTRLADTAAGLRAQLGMA